jgi:hypothetical protein
METSVVTAIIAALAVIGGAAAASFIQLKLARENNLMQLELQASRLDREMLKQELDAEQRRLIEVHRAVSHLSRQFSITALDIQWRAESTERDFDKHYMEVCESLDEVRAVSDLYIPTVSPQLEAMYGQMNIFWGNFKEMLRLTELKEPYERKQPYHQRAVEAAQEISSQAVRAKRELSARAHSLARGG